VRHWDTWTGPKWPSLFTVEHVKDGEGNFPFLTITPVELFGLTNDRDVSEEYIVYTTKELKLPEASKALEPPILSRTYQLNVRGIPRRLHRQPKAT
jgi:hypothetical protein